MSESEVPASHPRFASLRTREAIVEGVRRGVTSPHGLIAHGRGEAFDYLLGETTHEFARAAVEAAAATLLRAAHPVVSVNGNAAALVPEALIAIGARVGAPLEVNIFHASAERERAIRAWLEAHGARGVLMPTREATLDYIESNRRFVNPAGIHRADAVFVPLEDGDRCQALERMGKAVVTVDLNPMSRTARTARVTIVDNIVRAAPLLLERLEALAAAGARAWEAIVAGYDNAAALAAAERRMRSG